MRETIVINARDKADVLARVVLLFHRLNIRVDSLSMRRQPEPRQVRIDVVVESERDERHRVIAQLSKIVDVFGVSSASAPGAVEGPGHLDLAPVRRREIERSF